MVTGQGETFICPGHDYKGRGVSSVEEERRFNPRLTKSVDEFAELMDNLGGSVMESQVLRL